MAGAVAPWELGRSLPFQEDFHDTLQAVWVWARYRALSNDPAFDPNVMAALAYIRTAFEDHIGQPTAAHVLTRLYDSAFLLLAEVQYRRSYGEDAWPLAEQSLIARKVLREQARIIQREDFLARHYLDPFFHMFALLKWARHMGEVQTSALAKDTVARGVSFMLDAGHLVPMNQELCPNGPGGHDFMSKGGSVLLALNAADPLSPLLEPAVSRVMPSCAVNQKTNIVVGWPHRERDYSAFLLTAAWGLGTLGQGQTLAGALVEVQWEEFDARGGGIGREKGFAEAESWATFFLLFAYDLLIKKID